MKYLTFAALMAAAAIASANDTTAKTANADNQLSARHLDIVKVLKTTSDTSPSTTCGLVQKHMVYLDSKGAQHTINYTIEGYGCQNG